MSTNQTPHDLQSAMETYIAEQSYLSVVRRLHVGACFLLRDGKWPAGQARLPWGYQLRSATDHTPVPDETKRASIAAGIEVAADPKSSYRAIAEALKGAIDPGVKRRDVAALNLMSKSLYTWLSGFYVYRQPIPQRLSPSDLPDWIQAAILPTGDGRHSIWLLDFHHEELSQPWADPALIRKALARINAHSPERIGKEARRG